MCSAKLSYSGVKGVAVPTAEAAEGGERRKEFS